MIVVKVELWPHGDQARAENLGTVWIANTGGSASRGDYKAAATRKGEALPPWQVYRGGNATSAPTREGTVIDHPRLAEPVWSLVRKVLIALDY